MPNEENNVIDLETETIEVVETDLLKDFNFEPQSLRTARNARDTVKERLDNLSQQVEREEREALAKKMSAEKLVKTLRRQNFIDEVIIAALKVQFNQKKQSRIGDERQSHAVSDENRNGIIEYIKANPGINIQSIRDEFASIDHQGISIAIKKAITENILRKEGNTRNTIYYSI